MVFLTTIILTKFKILTKFGNRNYFEIKLNCYDYTTVLRL